MDKLQPYETVLVSKPKKAKHLGGKIGVVDGISQENGVVYGYAIAFDDDNVYHLTREELERTGEFADPDDLMSGEVIKILVDINGRGYLADEADSSK